MRRRTLPAHSWGKQITRTRYMYVYIYTYRCVYLIHICTLSLCSGYNPTHIHTHIHLFIHTKTTFGLLATRWRLWRRGDS